MLVLKGPAPNLDPGLCGPGRKKKQDPEPRIPKARTPNPNLKIPKFQGFPKLDFFLSKNAYFKGSGAKFGPWAFWTPNPEEARPRTQNSKSQIPEPNPKNSKNFKVFQNSIFSFQKMLVLKGPAPNLDPGPSGPRTQKKQDPEPRTPKPGTPNPTLRIPKFQVKAFQNSIFSFQKMLVLKGPAPNLDPGPSGPWAFWTPNPEEARPRTQNFKSQNPEPNPKNSKFQGSPKRKFFL